MDWGLNCNHRSETSLGDHGLFSLESTDFLAAASDCMPSLAATLVLLRLSSLPFFLLDLRGKFLLFVPACNYTAGIIER